MVVVDGCRRFGSIDVETTEMHHGGAIRKPYKRFDGFGRSFGTCRLPRAKVLVALTSGLFVGRRFLAPVTLDVELDDRRVMPEPIDGCHSHAGIRDYSVHAGRRMIGGG